MAVSLIMIKEMEDDEKVIYLYGCSEKNTGKIGYNKKSNEILDIEPLIIDGEIQDYYFHKTAQKLVVTAHKNKGIFPEKIGIAS